jgi:MSHA biogenesis protein MshJ
MGQLLGSIMDRHPGLVLKEVKNRPFVTVDIPGIEEPWLYRHGLFLKMEGNYLDVMEYIRQVEGLPRKIQWDSLNFKVNDFPAGTLTIEVFTLSISKEWLGA